MKLTMNKTLLAATTFLAFNLSAPTAYAALTLTFSDSTAAAAKPGACSGIAWTGGSEFRVCSPSGNGLAGGGQRNAITGGETYSFNDAGVMTGVTGTPGNLGATTDPGSAAPVFGTNPSWQQNSNFIAGPLNFLAPVLGSLAGTAYGPATYVNTTPTNGVDQLFLHVPVLEMQWLDTWLSLGSASGGVNFNADISNVVTVGNNTTFDFNMFANELIDFAEDPGPTGLHGFTAQWHMQGKGAYTAPVPVPAAVWLFGSGVLGLAGFMRRKKVV